MAQIALSLTEQMTQLEGARKLVLGDSHHYPQIVIGILPIISSNARLELRRWGAEFLAESFANPTFPVAQKEDLSTKVLIHIRDLLEAPSQDTGVVKILVQAAASIYGLVFRRVISSPHEGWAWDIMTAIKSNILKRMDSAPTGVRLCCIKFIQRVVHVQTPGVIADPRRPEQNETSIALVPRNHSVLHLPSLEAEASGLLDRLLDVFHDHVSNAVFVDASLNCLSILVRSRPAVANKIISSIINFNPLKQANSPMTPSMRVAVKSMERTTRAFLKNINKSNPNGPLAGKIDAYLIRLQQSRSAVFAAPDGSLKRPAPAEPNDGLDNAKRARLAAGPTKFPPLPPPPNTFSQLFTLTEDTALSQFDVTMLPAELVTAITSAILSHVDATSLGGAINAVKARYAYLQKMAQPTPVPEVPLAGPSGIDDEDDYEPEYQPSDSESPHVDPSTTMASPDLLAPEIDLGTFELPKPPPLSEAQVAILGNQTVERVFTIITTSDTAASVSRQKLGFNRLAASTNDRDAWITMMTRLATRAPAGLEDLVDSLSQSETEDGTVLKAEPLLDPEKPTLSNSIRRTLLNYILEDWRSRLSIAISWLSEEWYAEKIQLRSKSHVQTAASSDDQSLPNYRYWLRTLFEALRIYLSPEARDSRLLIRFLSEIPSIPSEILEMVASLAEDPERVSMAVMALQYLIMMRLPVREGALDCVEAIWRQGDEGPKKIAGKILTKWRPDVLSNTGQQTKRESIEGGEDLKEEVKKSEDAANIYKASEAATNDGGPSTDDVK
ncbi:MAG: hypothetical protein Q9227_004211 [Pyrenula ochraceoflavens]